MNPIVAALGAGALLAAVLAGQYLLADQPAILIPVIAVAGALVAGVLAVFAPRAKRSDEVSEISALSEQIRRLETAVKDRQPLQMPPMDSEDLSRLADTAARRAFQLAEMTTTMRRHAQEFEEAAGTFELRAAAISDAVKTRMEEMNGRSEEVLRHGRALTDAMQRQAGDLEKISDKASKATAQIQQALTSHVATLERTLEDGLSRTTEFGGRIETAVGEQVSVLDRALAQSETRTKVICGVLGDQARLMSETSAAALERTQAAKAAFEEQVAALGTGAESAGVAIATATERACQSGAAISRVFGDVREQAEGLVAQVRTQVESIDAAGRQVDATAHAAVESVRTGTNDLRASMQDVQERCGVVKGTLLAAAESVETAGVRATEAGSRTADAVRGADAAVQQLSVRLAETSDGVRKEVATLDRSIGDAIFRINGGAAALGEISDRTRALGDTFRDHAAAFSSVVEAASRTASEVEQKSGTFRDHAATVLDAAASAKHAIDGAAQSLDASGVATSRIVSGVLSQIDKTRASIESWSTTAADVLERVRAGAAEALASSTRDAGSMSETMVGIEASIRKCAEEIRNGSEAAMRAADRAAAALSAATAAVATQTHTLDTAVREAQESLDSAGSVVSSRTAGLKEAAAAAAVELGSAGALLDGRIASLGEAAERTLSQLETASSSLQEVDSSLRERIDGVVREAESATTTIGGLVSDASAHAQALRGMAGEITDRAEATRVSFEGLRDSFLIAVNDTAAKVQDASKILISRGEEMTGLAGTLERQIVQLQSAGVAGAEQVSASVSALEREVDAIERAADRSQAKITESAITVETAGRNLIKASETLARTLDAAEAAAKGRAGQLHDATESARQRVEEAASAFLEHGNGIAAASERAVAQLGAAGSAFKTQADELVSASEAARRQSEALAGAEDDARQGRLLKTARSVIETLNSLAVDLTQAMDEKGAERLLREYMSGNKGVFVKHLLRIDFGAAAATIRERYSENHEFRRAVESYLSGYEAFLTATREVDHENVLMMSFLTSDVGKLYLVLNSVMGRSK